MTVTAARCPQCQAPLTPPSRFARTVVCPFCGTTAALDPSIVSTARYKAALADWRGPAAGTTPGTWRWGESVVRVLKPIGQGEVSDAFLVDRARFPGERLLLKVLRQDDDLALLDAEWDVLTRLHASDATKLLARVPEPVERGVLEDGPHAGRPCVALRWAPGFDHTLEDARTVSPRGIDPRAAPWVWRRILETLALLHRGGLVHGAVLPQHVLIETGEHGARLCGFSCAAAEGEELRRTCTRFEALYSERIGMLGRVTRFDDLVMSGRCIAWALGGPGDGTGLPDTVPEPLANLVREVAGGASGELDPFALREAVGEAAKASFGEAGFNPLRFPD
jgi:hypothetical protein